MPRYTMDLTDDFDSLLTEMAKKEGVSKSEIIRRSVAVYKFMEEEVTSVPNSKIVIASENNQVEKILVMPFWHYAPKKKRASKGGGVNIPKDTSVAAMA